MKLCRNIFSQKCLTTVFSFSCSFYYFLAAFFFNCEKPRNKSQSWPPNKQLFVVKNILEARRSKVKSHCRSSFLFGKNFQFSILTSTKLATMTSKGVFLHNLQILGVSEFSDLNWTLADANCINGKKYTRTRQSLVK